jgi:tRNA nucleotidyltransferase (CCA-adding enzyme)
MQATKLLENSSLGEWQMYSLGWKAIQIACENVTLLGKKNPMIEMQQKYQKLPINNIKELAINGGTLITELNLTPGPQVGQLLADLEKAVVIGHLSNVKEDLLQQARIIIKK